MAGFVLIPGAGGAAWYWSRVVPILERAKHEVVAVELPADDQHAGLDAYAELVVGAIPPRQPVILVAQSMGGFTAPLVCARHPVDMLVFVNAMIPEPGETADAWGTNTGSTQAREQAAKRGGYSAEFDLATYFFHDLPEHMVGELAAHERDEAPIAFTSPCQFTAWPRVPTYVLVGKGDRLFPPGFQADVARKRLQLRVEEIDGGHLLALSNPDGLAERLLAHAAELPTATGHTMKSSMPDLGLAPLSAGIRASRFSRTSARRDSQGEE